MGVNERKEREKEQRKNDIIDAAETVFFSQGFDQATMLSIAEQAELSKGTLYLYFHNKNELCTAIILRALQLFEKQLVDNIDPELTGQKQFRQLIEIFFQFTQENPHYYKALSNFKIHETDADLSSEINQLRTQVNNKITQMIKGILDKGKKDATIDSNIDSNLLSYSIWGDQNGLLPNYLDYAADVDSIKVKQFRALRYLLSLIIKEVSIDKEKL